MSFAVCVDISLTSFIDSAVAPAISEPLPTAEMAAVISVEVLCAASCDLLARLRTSSATTAKPLPAAPARAASTAALSARMFVWNAMSSIVLMIFSISLDVSLISLMAWSMFWISVSCSLTRTCVFSESAPACRALSAVAAMWVETS